MSSNTQLNQHLLPALDDAELKYFCGLIGNLTGIAMGPSKHDLIRARLRSRLSASGHATYGEYRSFLETLSADHPEWQNFINLLTTNKTDFFREPKHFHYLIQNFLPEWLRGSSKTLRVWSSASSTGEEPYTLAMVLKQHLPEDRTFEIVATDIDTEVLAKAANAVYPMSKRSEIPEAYQHNAIDIGKRDAAGWFRIKRDLRDHVTFKQHNLVEADLLQENYFDLVLCRNVLIYFSRSTIEVVSRKLYACTKPGGHLLIGHSESLQGTENDWLLQAPAIYRKQR